MQIQKWKILKSKLAFNHYWCKVRQDEVELPNGKIIDDYFVIIKPDVALILPITSNQEVVFVRQYRHGVQEILLELPAGTFDPSTESPETAAIRELKEETGYTATKVTKLATLYDNPVKDTNKLHLFIAENVIESGQQELDVTEEIEVVLMPLTSIMAKITTGEICVSGSISAIFLGMNYLNGS
jgi:ADP-ribose pyrophosphatase